MIRPELHSGECKLHISDPLLYHFASADVTDSTLATMFTVFEKSSISVTNKKFWFKRYEVFEILGYYVTAQVLYFSEVISDVP